MNIDDALRDTVLDGCPIEEGLGGTLLINGIDGDVRTAWQAARDALPRTGRWPVFTGVGELYHEPTPAELAELDHVARTLDPWPELLRGPDPEPESAERAASYVTSCLGAGYVPAAVEQLGPAPCKLDLDRWVFDRLRADPAAATRARAWFEPLIGTRRWDRPDEIQLVLLPTPHPWLTPAFTNYFGGRDGTPWAAAMYQWHQRYAADLVACWGTALQFVVGRPPEPGEPAWKLAGQIMGLGGSLQEERWMHAMALPESDAWFLHDRP